jgi:cytochrome c biogenesis protein CcmG/thiol:disulfide interchange protein DsbE
MRLRSLLALALAVSAACAHAPVAERRPAVLDEAPFELELPDVAGARRTLAEHRGKVVLLDLWATWCKPCEASLPFYARLAESLGPEGLVVLAVNIDQDDEEVRRFLARRPLPFVVLRDPQASVAQRLRIETMPTAAVIGRDGRLVRLHAGFLPEDEAVLEGELRAALAAPRPPEVP